MTFNEKIEAFRKEVWSYYKKHGRDELPWRKTTDPYKILVSEVMLQQTQVSRVVEKYNSFIKKFPNVRALAKAPLSEVLKEWGGLGYNRRAKHLHDAAVMIVEEHGGKFPREYPSLRAIPGVGQYTANAVRVFAFDESEVLVETNVRTAIIHHFLTKRTAVEDFDVEKIAAAAAIEQDPRQWHSALFDYGAHLKRNGVRTNAQSAHYVRQSKFEGSLRQIRGAVLRRLQEGKQPLGRSAKLSLALAGLRRDGLIHQVKGKWRIA
ncbi:MAG TPA: A/G-specific adenine glycosylase [Candidatus Paceibacterota bacterium]|nr:A/G-specific adenine glycosylase [Candidatus Paceibacterota bacterium]